MAPRSMLKPVPKVRRRRKAEVGSSEDTLACERVESAMWNEPSQQHTTLGDASHSQKKAERPKPETTIAIAEARFLLENDLLTPFTAPESPADDPMPV